MVTLFNEVIIIYGEQMERLSRHFFSRSLEVIVERFNVMDVIYRFRDCYFINGRLALALWIQVKIRRFKWYLSGLQKNDVVISKYVLYILYFNKYR
jgi:hypothetical protein